MSMRTKRPADRPDRWAIKALAPSASGATTGPMMWPRPKRRSIAKPRAWPSWSSTTVASALASSSSISASRGMPRAAASSAFRASASLLPAGRSRQPASNATSGAGRAVPWCCRTSPLRTKPRRSYRPRPSGVACSSTLRPSRPSSSAVISRWPMRRPWQAGATITRPSVACCGPQRQRNAVPTTAPSRSATTPSPNANTCSQSAGRCGQRRSADSACAAARSSAVMARNSTPSCEVACAVSASINSVSRAGWAADLAHMSGFTLVDFGRRAQLASIGCGGLRICNSLRRAVRQRTQMPRHRS